MIEKDVFKKAIYVVNALAFGDSSRASCIVYRPGMENVYKINLLRREQRKEEFPLNFYRDGSLLSTRPGHVQDRMYSMMLLRCKLADLISRGYSSVIIHSPTYSWSHFFCACHSVCLRVCLPACLSATRIRAEESKIDSSNQPQFLVTCIKGCVWGTCFLCWSWPSGSDKG